MIVLNSFFINCILLCSSIVLEVDSHAIVNRVAIKNDDIPLGEQTMAKVTVSGCCYQWDIQYILRVGITATVAPFITV